jgi:dolichol-phosphate mannosyltransferase
MISIIIPTFNEAGNIRLIVPKLSKVLNDEGIDGEIIVVDDNSPDSTADIARELAETYPVRVHVRKSEKGLSKAVIKGFELAKGDICVVMDADLSHPVERVPAMIKPILDDKCDATVGSRNVMSGGYQSFPIHRKITSKVAGFMARGVTSLSDPTSGFMAINKRMIDGMELDSLGWKIVLEVIVKTRPRFVEIPIVFSDRKQGESKLDFKAQFDYIRHLWRLYCYKFPTPFQFIKFSLVGLSGLFVDTAVLVSCVRLLSFDPRFAAVFAFIAAVCWNYTFDRVWTFDFGRTKKISYSYLMFVTICLVGLGIRIGVMHLLIEYAQMDESPWYVLASFIGILSATIFNFFGSKYIAFSRSFKQTK